MFEEITGHKRQLEFLEKAVSKGRLAHAYCFAGPLGVGKKLVAKKLAFELLGDAGFQPDLIEVDGKDGIKIEQIRELIYKLSLKPYQGKYKVAIIDSAEQMTTEAANALLKSLEEPKDYTIIILITTNPNRLPKTIISRTQKITFGPITSGEIEPEKFYEIFQKPDLVEKLIAAYDLADLETVEIKNILGIWLKNLETELLKNPSKHLANKIIQVALGRKYLDQNVNSKLLLTNLMLNA